MKILIVGEFSGFAKELKAGFVSLGHECTVISWGDGKKQIQQTETDISFTNLFRKKNIFTVSIDGVISIFQRKKILSSLKHQELFDVCIVISTCFIKKDYWLSSNGLTPRQIKSLLKVGSKIYLTACGTDYPVLNGWQYLRKHPNSDYFKQSYSRRRIKRSYFLSAKTVDFVIPTHYEYAECYRRYATEFEGKILSTIPLPISVQRFEPHNQIKDNKIVIFLGRTSTFKGYQTMSKALDIITSRHPNVVRVPKSFLTQSEYFKVLSEANVLMDQCTSFSYGMSALYGLAMGKCVMTNNEPECCAEYGVEKMPFVNMIDDVDYIVNQLENIISHPEEILKFGEEGREYVENLHDSTTIAERYIELINNTKR